MTVVCEGITMYDIRTTWKGFAGEAITYGMSVFVAQDGLVYRCDNGSGDLCHGWAFKSAVAGAMVTVVTACRMEVDTLQTIGARLYSGEEINGSAPSTTLTPDGIICGFGLTADSVWAHVTAQQADAPATG